ncbi:MAG: ribonuclease III, partial [Acidimicrobiia bacterium]|nr:ribonuclease III [Acidimicrobiia bacterium]
LGDAVLQLAVTDQIYADYPDMPEGQMAKLRAAVVNEDVLARVAARLDVGSYLRVGRGEEVTGGREKSSILSDVVEALLGAVYLEAGYLIAAEITLRHVAADIDQRAHAPGVEDFKTRLQEVLAKKGSKPEYRVSDEGPDHDKVFHAEVIVEGSLLGAGTGSSKKSAEQSAAEEALRVAE